MLTVVSKCGRYIETALKLLSQCQEGQPVDLHPIVITLTANLKFLQDEYAALLVKGRLTTVHLSYLGLCRDIILDLIHRAYKTYG